MFLGILHLKLHRRRQILHLLVPFCNLTLGECRLAARADVHRAVVLVHEAFLVERLECPPLALHVLKIHGAVRVRHIGPAPEARDDALPFPDEREDLRAAEVVELLHAHRQDIFLGLAADLLLDDVLYRKPVAIPAPLAGDTVAAHGLVARYGILDSALEEVAVMWGAGGERRAIVEDEIALRRVLGEGFLEDAALVPEGQYGLFARGGVAFLGVHVGILAENPLSL